MDSTSPVAALGTAYAYMTCVGLVLWKRGFYDGSSYFRWGPPIHLFGKEVVSQKGFYVIHAAIFVHQATNNWVNSVVYPWIINSVQDPKCKRLAYRERVTLLLTNLFDFYSELDVVLILMGFTSQISFLITVTLANVLSGTYVNLQHLRRKRRRARRASEPLLPL